MTRAALEAAKVALEKSIKDYGKTGGPWNVPAEPGCWIVMAREALALINEALNNEPTRSKK